MEMIIKLIKQTQFGGGEIEEGRSSMRDCLKWDKCSMSLDTNESVASMKKKRDPPNGDEMRLRERERDDKMAIRLFICCYIHNQMTKSNQTMYHRERETERKRSKVTITPLVDIVQKRGQCFH